MSLSNAERQARWRGKRASALDQVGGDWSLFQKASRVLTREVYAEGRKGGVRISPPDVVRLAVLLERLIERWPDLPLATKKKLAAMKTADTRYSSLLPPVT